MLLKKAAQIFDALALSVSVLAMPAYAVFDMWESEKITGDPRNSAYVRGE